MDTSRQSKRCLVVGGGGFLGRHIVEKLLDRGYNVNVFDIRSTFEDDRVSFFIGDLCKKEDLKPALVGVETVFHCATPSPLSSNRELFHLVNVFGTEQLLQCCKESGVKKFVLTSSASVVYEGKDIENGLETLPYATKPMDYYTETKILQEKLVMDSSSDNFYTVAIRPHGIYGPRDPHMVPTTVRMAKAGKTKFIIGNGKNMVDFTHVENVVHGHILASENLGPDSKVNGKAYHITNDEPIEFWAFMGRVLSGLGYPEPKTKLPFMLVYIIAFIVQFFCLILSPIKKIQPTFTPMTVSLAGTHHFYSCQRAKEDFKYQPVVNMEKGINQTVESFAHLSKQSSIVDKSQ